MRKNNEKKKTAPKVAFGVGLSVLLCLVLSAVAAWLLLSGKMGEGSVEFLITMILFLSSITGNYLCAFREKQPILVIAVSTLIVMVLLLIGGLAADGIFENTLLRFGSVMAGSAISCLLCLKTSGKVKRKKTYYR